jgi:hypothetical protein
MTRAGLWSGSLKTDWKRFQGLLGLRATPQQFVGWNFARCPCGCRRSVGTPPRCRGRNAATRTPKFCEGFGEPGLVSGAGPANRRRILRHLRGRLEFRLWSRPLVVGAILMKAITGPAIGSPILAIIPKMATIADMVIVTVSARADLNPARAELDLGGGWSGERYEKSGDG